MCLQIVSMSYLKTLGWRSACMQCFHSTTYNNVCIVYHERVIVTSLQGAREGRPYNIRLGTRFVSFTGVPRGRPGSLGILHRPDWPRISIYPARRELRGTAL